MQPYQDVEQNQNMRPKSLPTLYRLTINEYLASAFAPFRTELMAYKRGNEITEEINILGDDPIPLTSGQVKNGLTLSPKPNELPPK